MQRDSYLSFVSNLVKPASELMTADKLDALSMQNLHLFKTGLQSFPLKKYRSFHDEGLALKHTCAPQKFN